MTNESLVLPITAYLYANVVLAPLFVAYLFLDPKKISLRSVLRFHRWLVTATVLLPLALIATSTLERPPAPKATASFVAPGVVESGGVGRGFGAPGTGVRTQEVPGAASGARRSGPATEPALTLNDLVFVLGGVLAWLSLAGLAVFIARYALQSVSVARLAAAATSREVRDGVLVLRSNETRAAFSVGCILKRVVVPDWMTRACAAVVIRHELNHFACGHHVWSFVEAALAHVFWFNPASHLLRKRGRFFRELECDSRTIQTVDRFRYARILVETAEHTVPGTTPPCGHAWIDRNGLKARVDFVLGASSSRRRRGFNLTVVAGCALATAALVLVGSVNDRFLRDQLLVTVIGEYTEIVGSRPAVELERVPAVLTEALLIQYDRNFYRHDGIEPLCMARRVLAVGFGSGGETADARRCRGSTLSQQLARTFLHGRERSVERKIRELKVTRVLESNFSKDELLEMYLNSVFFGNRAYGLAAAATTYFAKPYTELTRSEAAMLVPFLAAPSAYNMRANPEVAATNQRRLLSMMDEVEIAR